MRGVHRGRNVRPVYLPKGLRYGRIVLQRGTATLEPLALWFDTVRAGSHIRYPMVITMMDSAGKPVKIWTVLDAMPVKIDYGTLDAMSGSVVLTTVELVHGDIVTIM